MELKDRIELLIDAGSGELFEDEGNKATQWKYSGVDERHVGTPRAVTEEEKELVDFMGGNYNRELAKLYFEKRPVAVLVKFAKMMQLGLKVAYEWKRQETLPEDERTRGKVLRRAINELGPAFIKCGQTLSARGDLIGYEAAGELAELQNNTEPFSTEEAMRNLVDSFEWDGPIAPGIRGPYFAGDESKCQREDYLFKELSREPIASASLGQVYKGMTWEGERVAVKVQRPEILYSLLLDMYVLRLGLVALRALWGSDTDLTPIADEVAAGVWNELDYRQEAANAQQFEFEHRFLPYIKVPRYLMEYTTERVLTMEWVEGKKLGQLELPQQLDFMAKAIEASGAMLLQTGLVHADPHEGNILYAPNGDLVFIDFGLVSSVHPRLMEAFASGVINLITMDWPGFAQDFKDMELVPEQFMRLNEQKGAWEACEIQDFTLMIGEVIEKAKMDDFGDLVACVQQMADNYKFLCPPYTILLVRTFATLEGLAAKCDAEFNMYEACLPYAIRRGLAPTTRQGKKELRDTLINAKGEFAFENFQESLDLMRRMEEQLEQGEAVAEGQAPDDEADPESTNITNAITGRAPEIVGSLVTAPEGSTIRKIMQEADTVAFVDKVLSETTRDVQSKAISTLASSLQERIVSSGTLGKPIKLSKKPVSQFSSKALWSIVGKHAGSLLAAGPKGIFLLLKGLFLVTKIAVFSSVRAVTSACFHVIALLFTSLGKASASVANKLL
ncbi:UbiB-like protein kinase [Chloropicon primus]|uniref:UbiB-like protein kinase n=1 Tax=Chloropicon primus TaxID=1764295 RepID=A0A5B8MX06_9CHLO|nr:UbiB-like protein kinase [Chloropicon primus]UPR04564.1 UbiB-like protein kinase [Chloropicon primus]|eukprot:QDZ25358.1 UbiB-like protein kinase [Chloropicon primus]